jgi:PhoPQ-activated pathogenicity-related protein
MRPAAADLKSFMAKPEPAYHWEKTGEQKLEGGTMYDLHLVSQTWKNGNWEHRLVILKPDKLEHPEFCTVYNTGGSGSNRDFQANMALANTSGCMAAILYNIPNQPLYGGKTEDALIVYTWQQFFLTGDADWPLHFPMAKAVIKSMDAIQEFAKTEKLPEINSFLVYGGSKRGWTTWLVAASQDPRVKAIAPMVIDTLNVAKQIPHQLEAFGKASEQIGDYSSGGMLTALNTPRGQQLLALEDPYSYREILTLPKLLVLGTNDRYWAQDALNLYWDDLKGPKWVSYTPNSGHGLEDRAHVYATLSAFIRSVAGKKKFPTQTWAYADSGDGAALTIHSDVQPKSARFFYNSAPTMDFRDYLKWTSVPMDVKGKTVTGKMDPPTEGYKAVYGEVTYEMDGQPYTLSTQMRILPAKK